MSRSRTTPYQCPLDNENSSIEEVSLKSQDDDCSIPLDRDDLSDVTCSICMENPHNAVLLHCTSHQNGCRPYICATGFRYSNCLTRYTEASEYPIERSCPLCRGNVKSWSVDETARQYLNSKKRSCMQDDCQFVGSYRELRKHAREAHPLVKPPKVDPQLEQKWKKMEQEREWLDALSVIFSMRAVVMGDYVMEVDSDSVAAPGMPNLLLSMQDSEASGSVSLNARLSRLQQGPYRRSEQHTSVPGQVRVGSSAIDGSRTERVVLGRRRRTQRRRNTTH